MLQCSRTASASFIVFHHVHGMAVEVTAALRRTREQLEAFDIDERQQPGCDVQQVSLSSHHLHTAHKTQLLPAHKRPKQSCLASWAAQRAQCNKVAVAEQPPRLRAGQGILPSAKWPVLWLPMEGPKLRYAGHHSSDSQGSQVRLMKKWAAHLGDVLVSCRGLVSNSLVSIAHHACHAPQKVSLHT